MKTGHCLNTLFRQAILFAVVTCLAFTVRTSMAAPQPVEKSTAPTPAELPCGTPAAMNKAALPSNRSTASAKFEPPDGKVYFGFTFKLWDLEPPSANAIWGDVRPFAERICDSVQYELAGKTPTIIKVQIPWNHNFDEASGDITKIHGALGLNVTPMLEWQGDTVTTKDISSGMLDSYITQFAKDVKNYGRPLFIRLICGEFNGNWWQWCSPKANPSLTTQDFINAWRRVVDIFRQEGVSNVAWIWIPVAPLPPTMDWGWDPDWQSYYPGDDYVDWVGADMNTWGLPAWLDPVYQFGIVHDKPFVMAEFAIRHEGTTLTHQQQVAWLNDMFDYFESHPRIKAILYFNYKVNPDYDPYSPNHVFLYDGQVTYVPDVNDHDQRLIAGGADVRALFSTRIANPRYISTLSDGSVFNRSIFIPICFVGVDQ